MSRKVHEPAKPEPEAPASAPGVAEVLPEEDSFEARRAKRLAETHNKMAASHQEWGKTLLVIKIAAVFLVAFIGAYGWYAFIGSAPKTYFSLDLGESSYGAVAQLFSPDELVVADGKSVVLHDLKAGQARWTLSTKDAGDEGGGFGYFGGQSRLFMSDKDVWALQGGKLHQIDPLTGQAKKQMSVPGQVTEFVAEDNNLVVISEQQRQEYQVLVVNLATGESKSETIATRPKKEVVAKVSGNLDRPATSGNLLKQELEGDDEFRAISENTLFAAAGDHAMRIDFKIIKTNFTRVKVMRDAPKKSKLNSNTSAVSNPLGIAEDVFNDIKRSDGGQFTSVDESTYAITIDRILKGGVARWEGEIIGEPSFYAGKTVDLIVGYRDVIVLSKANKLLFQRRMEYPIGAMGGMAFRRKENAPFLETADTLYFWDKGSITAFDLPDGKKRWNFQNVGITSVVVDDKDGVFVCGTTASPDSIQFSEDITLENRPRAQFLKLDARSGKLEWDCKEGSKDVYRTGKFLYTTRPAGSTLGMMAGSSEADRTYIHRVNPRNGKIEWELEYKGDIDQMDVNLNRLAIVSDGNVKVLKFLSF